MSNVQLNLETGELLIDAEFEVQDRPILSPEQLLEQLVRLNKEINTRKEDIKQLIADSKFHKKDRPGGIPVDEIKKIAKTAVRYAAADYEEKKMEALEFFAAYERLTNYDD